MESTAISKSVFILYWLLCLIIPIFYLRNYYKINKRKRHKKILKPFMIAFIIFSLFYSVKIFVKNGDNVRANCYINNICSKETVNKEMENKTTDKIPTVSTSQTTTTSSTTKTTSTTTKTTEKTTKKVIETKYKKIKEPSGTKKVVGKSENGYTIYKINGVYYVDGYLIANKTYALPQDFVPTNTFATTNTPEKSCQNCINVQAYQAFNDMKADAEAVGIKLWIQSGYRSYILQNNLYNRYVKVDGKKNADTYSARPGHSEHQSGECFDLNDAGRAFNGTAASKWVNQNAYKYGFIIRYPEGKTDETGYIYESWHLRYVGEELANKLYNNGNWITMEKHFGLTSKYDD